MALNVKNERTVSAVRLLAQRRGITCTAAIHEAVDAALSTPDKSAEQAMIDDVRRIADDFRASLPPSTTLDEDALYDENGLFR
ncbi:MAG: type II toxin-antitoxin system VapB family antitoxin [Micrococcales bacterium]|nr:type II toxin-antitoxin system VapB family antitoxin [Micrococcales bacterium]